MKAVYGYIRVSTKKQSEQGVSLQEQKEAIQRYAEKNALEVIEWFEETQTAAKQGRTVFHQMLKQLQANAVTGVVIHKVDRSTRNLRDWVDLLDLLDDDVDLHFSNESIDMTTRGGRLSADIQAVVAADYIRNLRQEIQKGIQGRLKEGLYPFRAPVGYLDNGRGQAKTIDPIKGPLIKSFFERYATGEYGLHDLLVLARREGLTNAKGGKLSLNGISTILHNPFYMGLIVIKRTGQQYAGAHQALITKDLFNIVQRRLSDKRTKGSSKHEYVFRRMFSCLNCTRSLIPERQRGHVYYRCHLCSGNSVREEKLHQAVKDELHYVKFTDEQMAIMDEVITDVLQSNNIILESERKALLLEQQSHESRLSTLTDALIDGTVDKSIYQRKKEEINQKIEHLKLKLIKNAKGISEELQKKIAILEQFKNAYKIYHNGEFSRKRQLLLEMTSNRLVDQKKIVVELQKPFLELVAIVKLVYGEPYRGWSRTFAQKDREAKQFKKKLDEWLNEIDLDLAA